MALDFSTTAKASAEGGVKILVYGASGSGKTMLAATSPKPFIIGIEKGELSLAPKNLQRVYGVNTPGICYDIPMIKISNLAQLVDAYLWCRDSDYAKPFETIHLDSITDLAEVVLSHAKTSVKDPRQAYGEMNDKIAQIIRNFRDLPNKNIVFTAKQDREKEEVSGMMLYQPSMPGKTLTRDLPYFFDEVFALGIKNLPENRGTYRYFLTRLDPQYYAKDRSGTLDEIEKPNLSAIINKIKLG